MASTSIYQITLLLCFSLLLPLANCQTLSTSTATLTASDTGACNNFVGACVVYNSEDETSATTTTTVTVSDTKPSSSPESTANDDAADACADFTGACVVYNGAGTPTEASRTATATTTSRPGNSDGYIAADKGGGDGYIGEGASTSIGLAVISFVLVNVLFCVLL